MTQIEGAPKIPGVVIFTAILNFISVASFLFGTVLLALCVVFGNVMGVAELISSTLQRNAVTPNISYGLTFIMVLLLLGSFFFLLYFLFIGIGLLKGKAVAWYLQVAMSILGLLGFPIFTVINGAILYLFFRQNVRNYFKV